MPHVTVQKHETVPHELSLSPPTVSSLELTSALSVTESINTDIALKCSVLTKSSPSSRYAVTWQLQKEDGNETILSSDQNALVMFGSQLEPSFRKRLGIMRSEGPTFWLFIRHAHISDRGSYTCKVVEWFQASQNVWDPLTIASRTILLTLTEPGIYNSISADTVRGFKT